MSNLVPFLSDQLVPYLRDLEALVSIDCPSSYKEGVDRVGAYVRQRAPALGAEVEVLPVAEAGACLVLRWKGRGEGKAFMIGHLDTVYPVGTVASYPFRRDGARLYGPGSIDMKAGLLTGMYAAHALAQEHLDEFGEIVLFCNTDEEIGSPYSRSRYRPVAEGAEAGLVLEAARESGAIVSARKGAATYTVRAVGKSAHAGVEPEKGAHAVLAMAHIVLALHKLNGFREALTVNPGVIQGGTKSNVIPDLATLEVDLRVRRAVDAEAFETELRGICERETVPGVRVEFSGQLTNPPMERKPATEKLVAWAQEAGKALGLEIHHVATGGASDGNLLSSYGLPVLDGLGPQGGRAHNAAEEFVLCDSIVPRTVLLGELLRLIFARRQELRA